MEDAAAPELTPLERAAGTALGEDHGADDLPAAAGHPREALDAVILAALRRPPCVVSFSGGRDSSAVLAVAAGVARRHGLPLPVPVSLRFPGVRTTVEAEWQELVIAHLRLDEWERIELGDELDFLGRVAQRGLRAHGLLWPANAHFHDPVLRRASGGTVLTGLDGDGLLSWPWARHRAALLHPGDETPRALLRAGMALMPRPLRERRYRHRAFAGISWLTTHARDQLRAQVAAQAAREPIRWDRRVAWFARRRYHRVGVESLALLAADHGVTLVHPLLDPAFLAAVARGGGRGGYGTREAAMRALFGDVLPASLIARARKAEFGRALWGPTARGFAQGWNGEGIDSRLVDAGALRAAWTAENPPLAAATVMQAAWLQTEGMKVLP